MWIISCQCQFHLHHPPKYVKLHRAHSTVVLPIFRESQVLTFCSWRIYAPEVTTAEMGVDESPPYNPEWRKPGGPGLKAALLNTPALGLTTHSEQELLFSSSTSLALVSMAFVTPNGMSSLPISQLRCISTSVTLTLSSPPPSITAYYLSCSSSLKIRDNMPVLIFIDCKIHLLLSLFLCSSFYGHTSIWTIS